MIVAVLGAGGPAGLNVCTALTAAGHAVHGFDTNPDRLHLAAKVCEHVSTDPGSLEEFDAVHAQPEQSVAWLAGQPSLRTLMPSPAAVATCQDKARTAELWWQAGLRTQDAVLIGPEYPDWLHLAADRLGLPFWLRATRGAGARGATLVENVPMGYHWLRYWQERGVDWQWVAEEYLPGRDFCWTSLWYYGELIGSFARERLEWLYPHLAPSGRTGTPTVSVTVHDPVVNHVARQAVETADPRPNGIYCVDLREDRGGRPRPTEINAGRWATTSPMYHELGANLPDLHVRLAAGEHVDPVGDDIYPAGVKLIRHLDAGHAFVPSAVPVAA